MKIVNILLIGVAGVVAYKLARHIQGRNTQPVLVKNSNAASGPSPLVSSAPGTVIGISENGNEVKILNTVAAPASRSIFPGTMFEKFQTNTGGETVKTYLAAE